MSGMPRLCLAILAFASLAAAEIRYKVPPTTSVTLEPRLAARAMGVSLPGAGHFVIQFAQAPASGQIAALKALGLIILQDVPDDAVLVHATASVDLSGTGAVAVEPLPSESKISPLIPRDIGGYFIVEFHPDVDMNIARTLVLQRGLDLHENPDIGAHRLLVQRRMRARVSDPLRVLIERDEVAYVFPASNDLVRGIEMVPCIGAVTANGPVGQYIATVGSGWDGPGKGAATLRYVWGQGPRTLAANQAWPEILRAMNEWSKIVAVTWTQAFDARAWSTVSVEFVSGAHGDGYPFDGPGGVLAHTFYPPPAGAEPYAGDMHFDDDEMWRVGADRDVFSAALHELGHALGLAHSDNPNSVMYPYYRRVAGLHADDKTAILTLYAAATVPGVPQPPVIPTPPVTPPPTPNPPVTPPVTPPTPPTVPSTDKTGPSLSITNPATSTTTTTADSRQISGSASDPSGVQSVTWENSLGGNGVATGTVNWSANIPLKIGINRITVRATDNAGNETWRTLVITRK